MKDPMELQYTFINGTKIVARRFFLEVLTKAHEEIEARGIGTAGKIGFVPAGETTCSWRSLKTQQQLKNKGASKTLASNHRRGVAVDCYADRAYTERIRPIMEKYELVNDLRPWDAVHWNYKSNKHSWSYPFIDKLPLDLKEFSMDEYDNYLIQEVEESGSFALVYGGEKHVVKPKRAAQAALTVQMRGMATAPVPKEVWDSIKTGDDF